MSRPVLLVLLALTACTQAMVEPGGTTTTATTSSTTSTSTTTTTSTTTSTTTTTTLASGEAAFALTEVVFGDEGFVEITNVGDGPGSPAGYWLCKRPSYFRLPEDLPELEPGRSLWVAAGGGEAMESPDVVAVVPADGALGRLGRDDGEVGLYASGSFGDPSVIRSYVEWGATPHGRTSVAVEAGIWEPDRFVEVPPDAFGIVATERPPLRAAHWMAQVGG